MASEVNKRTSFEVPAGLSLLGFCKMVAPINKAAYTQDPCMGGGPIPGNVSGLPRAVVEGSKVAPSLCDVIRLKLEQSGVQAESVQSFLDRQPSLQRYDRGFRLVWAFLRSDGIDPVGASVAQVAGAIVKLFDFSIAQARNAYSGIVQIPGLQDLRFCTLLNPLKRRWNVNVEKYAAFWDPAPLLFKLNNTPVLWNDAEHVKQRLIICCRLLQLHRSVDLARTLRNVAFAQGSPFLQVKRKGWKTYKWEKYCVSRRPQTYPLGI